MKWVIEQTDAGTHAKFVGSNGETVWTTEVYTDPRAADEAIDLICSPEAQEAVVVRNDLRTVHGKKTL